MTTSSHLEQTPIFDQEDLIALIPNMRAFARSLCRNLTEADDLTQDALASAWRGRQRYVPGSNLKAWVFMIIRNQFYSDKRRSWRVSQLDPQVAEETLVAVTSATSALELDDVRRAMQELPDEQREALTLVAVAGLSYIETAAICACPAGTIKSRVSRARDRLTELLATGDLTAERRAPGLAMASIVASAEHIQHRVAA
jgi:RNA polymerase sigma-70 factor (ECF subfamily)